MFSAGRYSDGCARGRANNLAIRSRAVAADLQRGLVRAAYLTVYDDARLVTLDLPTFGASEPPAVGTRGKVNGLSDESRRRLMILLHTLKRDAANPAFVTLTFPNSRIPTPRQSKPLLAKLFKRWRRRCPQLCAVWRLEAHPARSAALGMAVSHFHLLVWGSWIDREQLSRDWAEVVDAPEFEKHLAVGTKVETIRSFRGVCFYAGKYISKVSPVDLGSDAGRVWGIFNREAMDIAACRTFKLTTEQTIAAVREVRRILAERKIETEWMPRAIFVDSPADFLARLQL